MTGHSPHASCPRQVHSGSREARPPGLLLLLLVGLCAPALAQAEGPPSRPILRLETGMHQALIRRVAADREGRWLVTASDDKTARVWDARTGAPLGVLRPPIGADADEGKLYAVALSPDGGTVAVAGWTGHGWDGAHSIYLFERASGRLVRRVTGLPNVILHLSFSPDGRHLAATLGRDNGLRVYAVDDGREIVADRDYGSDAYGAAFDPWGRLVTSSYDGWVRLYDAAFQRVAKIKPPGGGQPYGLALSPDGAHVAVGFEDGPAVTRLSARDLSPLATPDTGGVSDGNLMSPAFSPDGVWLYAGGRAAARFDGAWSHFIRRWDQRGLGEARDFPVAGDTLMDLRALRGGRLAFAAADPAWGVLEPSGRVHPIQRPVQADLRDNLAGFRLSADGARVAFGLEQWGRHPVLFDLAARQLRDATIPDPSLGAPRLEASGLVVSDWKNAPTPRLNGKALPLKPYETARSLAVAPDGESFVLGAEWTLRRFHRTGRELWQRPTPGITWAANISGDGRLVVAGHGDGTLRWHRMSDGEELLALFVTRDGQRWVAWNPSGYFLASPGAERMIGWHLNRGAEREAQFYPVARFRDQFARPDLVERVLTTLDEAEALRLADAERGHKTAPVAIERRLPPVVRLLDPGDGATFASPRVTLRYQIDTPADAPVTSLRPLLDGRPLDPISLPQGAASPAQGAFSLDVPERDLSLALIAENRHGASEAAQIRLAWRGAAAPGQPDGPVGAFVIKPKLYLLAIGVSRYQAPDLSLTFPAKDAQDFVQVVSRQGGTLYREVVSQLVPDATRQQVLEGLEWLEREVTAKDVAMLFLAGHGVNDRNGDYYFIPADASPERLKSTAVIYTHIKSTLTGLPGKVLLFLDTCHSGNVLGKRRAADTDVTQVVNDLIAAENGVVVFTAATGRQYSLESPDWGNGAFTKALVEGLSGKANYTGDGRVTINQLDLYLSERVKELTQGQQTPTTAKPHTIQDFPIALVR